MTAIGAVASLLIGICLGFFGGGGSILTVPLLAYVFGLEPKPAIASSLLIVGTASGVAAVHHGLAGHVSLRTAIVFGISGMLGAYAGGRASAYISGSILLLAFGGMMLLTGIAMWRGRRERRSSPRAQTQAAADHVASARRLVLQGLVVGSLTGLVGAGGGFLIVPALTLWAGLPMRVAIGTSLVIIVMNTAAGFSGYAHHVDVSYPLVAGVTTMAIGGSLVGAWLAARTDPNRIRRGFAMLVTGMAIVMIARELEISLRDLRDAFPSTAGELAFVFLILILGTWAGRVSERARTHPASDRFFDQGGGI